MSPPSKSVAIIGAGVAGLAAAASVVREGLSPTVFEADSDLGGTWNVDLHPCWTSMRVNVSKFSTVLSDFPWPRSAPLFPSQAEVHAYLNEFARTQLPPGIFRFGSRVTEVARDADGQRWRVTAVSAANGNEAASELFDFVIVTSGFFSEPSMPTGLGSESDAGFSGGGILHSSEYHDNGQVAGKRVLIVGGSMSAVEIAADAALTASEVVQVSPHGFWAVPRFIVASSAPPGGGGGEATAADPAPNFVPLDVALYKAEARQSSAEVVFRSPEEWSKLHAFLTATCGGRQSCCGDCKDDGPAWITISDLYYQFLEAGKISLIFDGLAQLSQDALLLASGRRVDIGPDDVVILCSGYRPNLSFLGPEILQLLEHSPAGRRVDTFCPVVLHQCILHPQLPGLGFVGMYRGAFWSVIGLQAGLVASVFAGTAPAPTPTEMAAGLEVERRIRDQRPRPQFPHADVVGMCNDLYGSQPTADFLLANIYRRGGPDPAVIAEVADVCADADGALAAAGVARALHSTRWRLRRRSGGGNATEEEEGVAEVTGRSRQQMLYRERVGCDASSRAEKAARWTRAWALVHDESAGVLSICDDHDGSRCRLRFAKSPLGWAAEGDWLGRRRLVTRFCFAFRSIRLTSFTLMEETVTADGGKLESWTEFVPLQQGCGDAAGPE